MVQPLCNYQGVPCRSAVPAAEAPSAPQAQDVDISYVDFAITGEPHWVPWRPHEALTSLFSLITISGTWLRHPRQTNLPPTPARPPLRRTPSASPPRMAGRPRPRDRFGDSRRRNASTRFLRSVEAISPKRAASGLGREITRPGKPKGFSLAWTLPPAFEFFVTGKTCSAG